MRGSANVAAAAPATAVPSAAPVAAAAATPHMHTRARTSAARRRSLHFRPVMRGSGGNEARRQRLRGALPPLTSAAARHVSVDASRCRSCLRTRVFPSRPALRSWQRAAWGFVWPRRAPPTEPTAAAMDVRQALSLFLFHVLASAHMCYTHGACAGMRAQLRLQSPPLLAVWRALPSLARAMLLWT
eukprot:TRINITY_DN9788_c2_g1_i1.p2 TRINITY_DN9788_c2_g1~~TRINITY_DN9788_c2_g1_i1.p2  ORF type:complete len:186 (-),score=31.69 TRINITY_DN9788_c2_g1_i1:257-814(-)